MIVELSPASPVVTCRASCLPLSHDGDRAGFDGARRNVQAFGLLDNDFRCRAHPNFQPFRFLVELEGDVVADCAAAARWHLADAHDVRGHLPAVECFDRHGRDLPHMDVADF